MKLFLRKPWHYNTNARRREMGKPIYKPTPIEDDEEWETLDAIDIPETVPSVSPKSG